MPATANVTRSNKTILHEIKVKYNTRMSVPFNYGVVIRTSNNLRKCEFWLIGIFEL